MSIVTSVLNLADVPGDQTIPRPDPFQVYPNNIQYFGLLRESILLVFSNKGTKAFPRKDACLHCKWLAIISWNAPADVCPTTFAFIGFDSNCVTLQLCF